MNWLAALPTAAALAAFAPAAVATPTLVQRIDGAVARAAAAMIKRQSADGAWRSRTYGIMKDGPSLTPFVMSALFFAPQAGDAVSPAYRRGAAYLRSFVDPRGRIREPDGGFIFPVLSAANAARAIVLLDRSPANLRARDAWVGYLRSRQLTGRLGWRVTDSEYGGWGFSLVTPRKPTHGTAKGLLVESNMVATVFGVAALRSARAPASDPAYAAALQFVERCQNWHDQAVDPVQDDGGFFFIPDDEIQNKAGAAGVDARGRLAFHSYGSMTADGVRALIRCGLPLDHPRVTAARRWLERNFRADTNPGVFEPDREVQRDSVYYYWCWAAAHALAALQVRMLRTDTGDVDWATEMAGELLKRQRPSGVWVNRFTDAKEDDPLVATPWASSALSICREVITGEQKALVMRPHRF